MKIVLEVGRNFVGRQVINVAKLVSQRASKGDCTSHDSTTFAIGDTFLARSTRVARKNDMRPNKILVGSPVIGVGVEFALQPRMSIAACVSAYGHSPGRHGRRRYSRQRTSCSMSQAHCQGKRPISTYSTRMLAIHSWYWRTGCPLIFLSGTIAGSWASTFWSNWLPSVTSA